MKKKYITPSVELYSAILETYLCAGSIKKDSDWGNNGTGADDSGLSEDTGNGEADGGGTL